MRVKRAAVPRPATTDFLVAARRPLRIVHRRMGVVILGPPVGRPLPDVAVDVE